MSHPFLLFVLQIHDQNLNGISMSLALFPQPSTMFPRANKPLRIWLEDAEKRCARMGFSSITMQEATIAILVSLYNCYFVIF